ncbi:MAG: hypothetical protein ACE5F5_07300 [Acidimicrobiia bacterium]
MSESRRPPPWLLGLIIAAALFLLAVLILGALGFGDNPVLDTGALAPMAEA